MESYAEFLDSKRHTGADSGFDPVWMPEFLFDFQKHMTEWAIRKGRGALFADCGLGKTAMQLVWAENVHRKTNQPVLILTPLAVAQQTISEGEKFQIEARLPEGGIKGVVVTNYERLHKLDANDFAGVVCDESSILKSFDGERKLEITQFMRKVPYRLLATATAAPNDYVELGTSSEALGYLGHMDMLSKFFINDRNNSATRRMYGEAPEWRFKGHAETAFWRWVCSWAMACRKPSDLGFDDTRFILPDLLEARHQVEPHAPPDGWLFPVPAVTLREQRIDLKNTLQERCEQAAALATHDQPALVWCHLNEEGDLLEKLIPGAIQVSGRNSDLQKQERFAAFLRGQARVLVTKPKIGAWGLNFQHCAHVVFFPSHSYEQYYQAVRRCWRFGQKRKVKVDLVLTEGQQRVMDNLQRKSDAAQVMFARLIEHMNEARAVAAPKDGTLKAELPQWL